ncbi:MAG: hypothetical protein IPG85_15285 [Bacteroidetes bacterium]|nr:hypothetical protein [Bacteroidota bacterium]
MLLRNTLAIGALLSAQYLNGAPVLSLFDELHTLIYYTDNFAESSADSVVKRTFENEQIDEYNLVIDANKNVYSLTYTNKNVVQLLNGQWISIHDNLKERVQDLALAADGSLYASTGNVLYKRVEDVWVQLFSGNKTIYKVMAAADGNIYGQYGGFIVKWGLEGWEIVGADKMRAITPTFGKYLVKMRVDSEGRIFVTGDFTNVATGNYFIACWNGSDWINIGDMPGKTYDLCVDRHNIVYVRGFSEHKGFYRQWDGHTWKDVVMPAGTNNIPDFLQDHPGNVYIRIGDSDKERKYNKFYTLLNGKSEFLFEYPWHESGSVNIPVNNEMMYMIVKRYLKEYKIVKTK